MKSIKVGLGLLCALLTVIAGTPSARADDCQIPGDVIHWFETMGPGLITADNDSTDGNLSFPSGATLGDIAAVYQVGDRFLDSRSPSASLLAEPLSWSAPVLAGGGVVGTLTVVRSVDGTFAWGASDDWWNGNMIATLPSDGRYVNDGRNGAFTLVNTAVRQATNAAIQKSPHQFGGDEVFLTNAATLRDALKQQRSDDALAAKRAGDEPVMGGGAVYLPDFVALHGQSTPGLGISTPGIALIGVALLCMMVIGGLIARLRRVA